MSALRSWLLMMFVISYLGACGSKSSDKFYAYPDPTGDKQASQLARQFSIQCENPTACPDGTGVLFGITDEGQGYACTGFLAGEKDGLSVIGTNKHCGQSLSHLERQLAIVFPGFTGHAPIMAFGHQQLAVSPYDLGDSRAPARPVPDYAFFQLDRHVDRPVLPLTQSGLAFSSPVTLYVADISGHSVMLRTERCHTISAPNGLTPNYLAAQSSNVGLDGCNLKRGESGSPVLNAQGQVAAIVEITMLPPDSPSSSDARAIRLDSLGVATNLACVNAPDLRLSAFDADVCQKEGDPAGLSALLEAELKRPEMDFVRSFRQGFLDFVKSHDNGVFTYKYQLANNENYPDVDQRATVVEVVPDCLLQPSPQGWIAQNSGFEQAAERLGFTETLPAWVYAEEISPELILQGKVTPISRSSTYTLLPNDSANAQEFAATLIETPMNGDSRPSRAFRLRWCETPLLSH